VPDRWVVNASPRITLAKAGHLTLVTALATEVLLPEAVVAEGLDGPGTDPARQAVEGGWGTWVAVPRVPVPCSNGAWGRGKRPCWPSRWCVPRNRGGSRQRQSSCRTYAWRGSLSMKHSLRRSCGTV
jgi:hypothetical protein